MKRETQFYVVMHRIFNLGKWNVGEIANEYVVVFISFYLSFRFLLRFFFSYFET